MAEENNRPVTCCPQDVLKKVCPDAKVEGMDADGNMVTGAAAETVWLVPCDEIESISQVLKEKAGMDFLRDLMGTDEGEGRTGVYYFMERTSDGVNIILKAVAQEWMPSVTAVWQAALLKEREVYDFFGLKFLNHPDMRRLFLREDWHGWPLRKDYIPDERDDAPGNEKNTDVTVCFRKKPNGDVEAEHNVLFEDGDFVVNIGPQHPSTHGVLRMRTAIEGETVKKVDPILGYIHRGIEKLSEKRDYRQALAMTDRLDYLSAHHNRHALCLCVEKAAGIEVPERAQCIRTMMDELQRINSHLLFYSCLAMDMGALTPFFYGFREREMILEILEETTGGRLIQNYYKYGGVQADIQPDFLEKVRAFTKRMRDVIKDYDNILTKNVIAQNRLMSVGFLSKEDAISIGTTGGTGRATGWANDVRKRHPYAWYDRVDFEEVVYSHGDSFDRYKVRMDEILVSCDILDQLADMMPEGAFCAKTPAIIKLPAGVYTAAVEASRGEFGVCIVSDGGKSPVRIHFRSTGLPLVQAMDTVCRGGKIADLVAIGGTLDFVIPDIDR